MCDGLLVGSEADFFARDEPEENGGREHCELDPFPRSPLTPPSSLLPSFSAFPRHGAHTSIQASIHPSSPNSDFTLNSSQTHRFPVLEDSDILIPSSTVSPSLQIPTILPKQR